MTGGFPIVTERCRLRPLTIDDATPEYLAWFRDPEVMRTIGAAASTVSLEDLRAFIDARDDRPDVLFLGIFSAADGTHIGNIKYEPIDDAAGYAIMGILIGNPAWRGRGIAQEVLRASAAWLAAHRGIREILLGVSKDNPAAVRAYETVGFRAGKSPHLEMPAPNLQVMVWTL